MTKNDSKDGAEEGFIVKIRGMPWSTTADEIIKFFGESKILNGADGIHLLMTREGRPSGEAFIELESEVDLKKALKKDREYMGSRYIEVFKCNRSEMDWILNKCGTNFDYSEEGFVRLRGLPFEVTREEIAQFFVGLEIMPNGITLPLDHKGKSTGEAFVQFRSKAIAEKALNRHKEKIGHRYIEVFRSSMSEVFPESRLRGGAGMFGQRPAPYDARNRFGGTNRFGTGPNGRNMREDGEPDDNYDLWNSPAGPGGPLPPCAPPGGPPPPNLSLGWNTGPVVTPRSLMGSKPSGFGMTGSAGASGSGGGSGPKGPYIIHMRGLPFKATKQEVADFFLPTVPLSIDLGVDATGRPSGEADVEFRTYEDACEAMRKHRSTMSHRYIELFMTGSQQSGARTKPPSLLGGIHSGKRF